ncbi:MAG: PIN domain-containing protein [Phormidesmis sp. CAN_BIN44]|nr:PIN domain-containing protein [Phormidesmis sp. CAN_BIN44]
MEIAIADTSFVVALLNQTDVRHSEVVPIYTRYLTIVLPQTVLAEVAYLIGRDADIQTVVAFLRGLAASRFCLTTLMDADIDRVAEILQAYADSRIDFIDASVMAAAERYGSTKVLMLDQRDFRLFQPKHCNSFEILP